MATTPKTTDRRWNATETSSVPGSNSSVYSHPRLLLTGLVGGVHWCHKATHPSLASERRTYSWFNAKCVICVLRYVFLQLVYVYVLLLRPFLRVIHLKLSQIWSRLYNYRSFAACPVSFNIISISLGLI